MIKCPRCEQPIEDTTRQTCPLCFTPLYLGTATPAAPPSPIPGPPPLPPNVGMPANPGMPPNVRVALTGEVIEQAPPPTPYYGTPPASAPPSGGLPPHPIPPPQSGGLPPHPTPYLTNPQAPFASPPHPAHAAPPHTPAAYGAAPAARRRNNKNAITGIILGAIAGVVVLILGVGMTISRYREQQTALENGVYRFLKTPEGAARELVAAFKKEDWNQLYYLCEFGDAKGKNSLDARRFENSFKPGVASGVSASDMQNLRDLMAMIQNVQPGTPQVQGSRADVPLQLTYRIEGLTVPVPAVAHLSNYEGKWRLDLTAARLHRDSDADEAVVEKAFSDLFGINNLESAVTRAANGAGGAGAPGMP